MQKPVVCGSLKENRLYGEKVVLARRLQCYLGIGTVQFYPSIIISIFPPAGSLVYLSIFLYPANMVPLRHRLASLAWQVHLHSL